MSGAASLQSSYTGSFTLPHRSDGTLGRGPRSEPRAPMQMVSGALGSLLIGFRVEGLSFSRFVVRYAMTKLLQVLSFR